jgi:hypothetical protein
LERATRDRRCESRQAWPVVRLASDDRSAWSVDCDGSASNEPGTVGLAAYTRRAPRTLDAHGRPAGRTRREEASVPDLRPMRRPGPGARGRLRRNILPGKRATSRKSRGWSRFAQGSRPHHRTIGVCSRVETG